MRPKKIGPKLLNYYFKIQLWNVFSPHWAKCQAFKHSFNAKVKIIISNL